MKRFLIFVVVAGLVLCSALPVLAVSAGQLAPDFQGQTLEGKEFKLSDFKGELILLKIGTTWCPSCRTQAKTLDSLHQYLAEKGVRVVDVFVDESKRTVSKYFRKTGYQKPAAVVLDSGAAHKAYNVYVIPRVVLIDKDFNVVRDGDALSANTLKQKIEAMVKID